MRPAARRLAELALVPLLLTPASLTAQAATEPAAIPTPLVRALLGWSPGMPASFISVDAPPPGWPSPLIPRGMRPLGGTRYGRSLQAIFVESDSGALNVARDSLLAQAGFSHPVMPTLESAGFMSNPMILDFWCRDSAYASTGPVGGAMRSPRMLWVRYSAVDERCHPKPRPDYPMSREPAELPLPRLVAPPGARQGRGGSSQGESSLSASATVTDSTRQASALAAHYVAQLAAAGWTVSAPASTERAAVATLDARDRKGLAWRGALTVISRGSEHDVSIAMTREPQK